MQNVPRIQGHFSFDLKPHTTVYLSLEIWDDDGRSSSDHIRDIKNLVIPFNEIRASNVMKFKRFTLPDRAFLDIEYQITKCYGNSGGNGCSFCADHKTGANCNVCQKEWTGQDCEECAKTYFPEKICNVRCIAVVGRYACANSGKKVCYENWKGEECEKCSEGWGGSKCKECAQDYYPEGICNVRCIAFVGRYTCSDSGKKVCFENWRGAECDICAEHRTGETCEKCTEGWGGNMCQECAQDYYPEGICNVRCIAFVGRYTCSDSGKKVCFENWRGAECDICAEHRTGETCEKCTEGWGGNMCQECAQDYYPEGICYVKCTAVEGRYTCSNSGKKLCNENWKGAECDICAEHRTGDTCEKCTEGWGGNVCQECAQDYYPEGICYVKCIAADGRYTCSDSGKKACNENWKGEECEKCSEGWGGSKCQECAQDYYPEGICNVRCIAFVGRYTCSNSGKKVCNENWKGAECDNCAEHRTGETCEKCTEGWGGNMCQECAQDYYPEGICYVKCIAVDGRYTCSDSGKKACNENWKGEDCEKCSEEWGGSKCQECAQDYFPEGICNVRCIAFVGRYTCSNSGKKVCFENWKGAECDICAEHRTGETCENCSEGWGGNMCQECAQDYYPEGICYVKCTAVDGRYTCSNSGKKVCYENWKGAECDICAEHRTGETCENCSEGWGGNMCQECAQDYYPEGICYVKCTAVDGRYTCSNSGKKVCYENWKGAECDICAEHRTGETCEKCTEGWGGNMCQECAQDYYPEGICYVKCITVDGRNICSDSGKKVCNENWKGAECDICAEHRTGETCEKCSEGWGGNRCQECAQDYYPEGICYVKCIAVDGRYTCSDSGKKACNENWKGEECEKCSEGWGGSKCQECAQDYYPAGICNVRCIAFVGRYTCSNSGIKVCYENWKGAECDICAEHRTGETCEKCSEGWGANMCQECAQDYYPEGICYVKCTAVDGRYTCSNSGKKACFENWKGSECDICAEHRTGETCEKCTEGWGGNRCQECAQDYYPEGICYVKCIAVDGRYTCSDSGKKVCNENWKGAECDYCAEHRTGETCEKCSEGWGGNMCQECAQDYYPEGICYVKCTAVDGRYTCSDSGKKVCNENWKGVECDNCAEHRTGETCEKCTEGWGGNMCQECAQDYYPEGICYVKCTAVEGRYTCSNSGKKLCNENWKGAECDICAEHRTGDTCEKCTEGWGGNVCQECAQDYYPEGICYVKCIAVDGRYTCSDSGKKACNENWKGEECEKCSEGWGGSKCQECAQDYYPEGICNVRCIAFVGRYTCSNSGKKVCYENWKGAECDNCAEHRTGETCEKCTEGWGGNMCQECAQDYYPEGICYVKCIAVDGRYTCSDSGKKACNENWKGEDCEKCSEEWGGSKCQECAQDYFPEGICNVRCIALVGRYTCSNSGKKVCFENWKGAECDICAEHRTGETCENCSEGWGGNMCQECAQDYYPEGICYVKCTAVDGRYTCSNSGKKVCYENWKGAECDICAEHRTGETCENCSEGWGGNMCQECAQDYYPEGICYVKCTAVDGRYTCSNSGKKVCYENWKGAECDICAEHRTGETCEKCTEGWGGNMCQECAQDYYPEGICYVKCITVDGRYICSDSGKKVCNENWKGAECDICAEHRTGETCEKCSEGWGGNRCQECAQDYYPEGICYVKCIAVDGRYTCSDSGKKACNENWKGEECEKCSEGWGGSKCQECAQDYYPAGICNVRCIAFVGRYTCSNSGIKVCYENWKGAECDICAEHRTGETCEKCSEGWGANMCQECAQDYYPEGICYVKCTAVDGRYTCSNSGKKACFENWKGSECDICAEHRTGETCEKCTEGWGGNRCQECAQDYYPEGICYVKCIAVDGRYTCSDSGKKVCNENWKGAECDYCAEHRTGETCEKCSEGWGGNMCQECAQDYYPEGICYVKCTAVDGRYTCSDSGKKVCNENWKGVECDNCAEHRTGETCEKCSEGWEGNMCQECAQDYYPESICYVKCTAVEGKYTCSDSGKKVCNENWKGAECDNCAEHRTGENCEKCSEGWGGNRCQECAQDYYPEGICYVKCIAVDGRYTCSDSGKKACNENWKGEECEKCSEGWGGSKCQECAQDYYPEGICNVRCIAFVGRYTCSNSGMKVCYENWKGAECDICAEHRTGETCEKCSEGWGANMCQECDQDYYPEGICYVKCIAVDGIYTCSDSGKKVCFENWKGAECDICAEHRTGETCEKCTEGWGGNRCQECAQDYYPEGICYVKCIAVDGIYTCSDSGKKVCFENWKGAECDICAEHRTGETCEKCTEGWGGNMCQECAQDYYPEGICYVKCTAVEGKYTCSDSGKKVCNENWKGVECDNCADHRTGETCEKCSEGWGGNMCQECAQDYYPVGICNVNCTEVEGKYTCSESGKKVCNENWKGAECDKCADHRTGETCEKCNEGWGGNKCQECAQDYYPDGICNVSCTEVEGKYTCSESGKKLCNENWKGAECDNCAEYRTGETCQKCREGWGGDKCQECAQHYYPEGICNVKCTAVEGKYTCSDSGKKVCYENLKGAECDICAEHRTGETCEKCTEGWGGNMCQECAQDYYPEGICYVKCITVDGRYICSDSGKKVCNENWKGADCDICAEHRTGETCENCSEGWGGNRCQECAQDYYPEGICYVKCIAVDGRYTCSDSGKKACNENWKGEECEKCSEGWGGSKCQECAQDYYPEGICNVRCIAFVGRYTCSNSGMKVCYENWKGAECDICAEHRTGETCEKCSEGWGANMCQECDQDYYPEGICYVKCIAVDGIYTCSDSGKKVCFENWKGAECDICAEHRTGETCEKCTEGWGGNRCQECAQDYYPEGICYVKCIAVDGIYTCSDSGKKVCFENWKGAECDICAEHRTGETCEKCTEGWGGNMCQECAQDYYPEGICYVKCTAVEGKYTCSDSGKKVCNENWKGVECDNCADHKTGETCEKCSEGWGGNKCQECGQDYYPEGICYVKCTAVEGKYTCSDSGKKVCNENWKGVECDNCADHRTGETCEQCSEGWGGNKCQECAQDYYPEGICNVSCTEVEGKYTCSESGKKLCNENWKGAECDNCAEYRTGETCQKCREGWGGDKCQECAQHYYPEGICNVKCTAVEGKYTCSDSGKKVCYENWKGAECDKCADHRTGETCEKCSEGWGGNKCQECAQFYYPEGFCNVKCTVLHISKP